MLLNCCNIAKKKNKQVLILQETTPKIIDNILYESVYFKLFFVNYSDKFEVVQREREKIQIF